MTDLAVWRDVVRPDQIQIVDFLPRNEFVNLNRARGFERDVFKFFLGNLKVCVGIDLVSLDDVPLETSSPVSASTFWYLIRCPVFRLIWLKLIFSDSDVAGKSAIGHVTRESRKKPFQ
jgi:hypothetical protein